MTMVNQKSEETRTLTGFHGGLRRGTAAAALGAVLVLSAGVPASNAVSLVPAPDPTTDGAAATASVEAGVPLLDAVASVVLGPKPEPSDSPEPGTGKPTRPGYRTQPAPSPTPTTEPASPSPSPTTPTSPAPSPSEGTLPPSGTPSPSPTGGAAAPSTGPTQTPGSPAPATGAVPAAPRSSASRHGGPGRPRNRSNCPRHGRWHPGIGRRITVAGRRQVHRPRFGGSERPPGTPPTCSVLPTWPP